MKKLLITLGCVAVVLIAFAAPILQSGWTTTTDANAARASLHAVAETSGNATNLTARGAASNSPAVTVPKYGSLVIQATNAQAAVFADYGAFIIGTNASTGGAGGEMTVPNNFRMWDRSGNYWWMMPDHAGVQGVGPTMLFKSGEGGGSKSGGIVFNPGINGNFQAGNSGLKYNQTFTIQYNDETMGWSHLFQLSARSNSTDWGTVAFQARVTNNARSELWYWAKAPIFTTGQASGFNTWYEPTLIFRTNGLDVLGGKFWGDGSSVTNLNADELRSGTVPSARITGSQDIGFNTTTINANSGNLILRGETGGDYVVGDGVGFLGNGSGLTNLPITSLQGSGGAGTAASNGTAGLKLTSAGNGGVYWDTDQTGGGGASLPLGTNMGDLFGFNGTTNLFFSAKNVLLQKEEWMGGALSSGQWGELSWLYGGSGGSIVNVNLSTPGRPGVGRYTTDSTAGRAVYCYLGPTAGTSGQLNNRAWRMDWFAKPNTNIYALYRIGLAESPSGFPPNDGIYWEFYETVGGAVNWTNVSRNNLTQTTTNTTTAVDLNWHQFTITCGSSTNISFYLDGVLKTTIENSNIPIVGLRPFVQLSNYNAVAVSIDLDAWSFAMPVSR